MSSGEIDTSWIHEPTFFTYSASLARKPEQRTLSRSPAPATNPGGVNYEFDWAGAVVAKY
jgi:hypothetical protein